MLSRAAIRQRVAETLTTLGFTESGQTYDRFLDGADRDVHWRFAVKLGGTRPMRAGDRQDPIPGMLSVTTVRVRLGWELRPPPHAVEDSDAAEEQLHAALKTVQREIGSSPDLELIVASVDEPQIDRVEQRWWVGGFTLDAGHFLALE